jgi:hypothetical protein
MVSPLSLRERERETPFLFRLHRTALDCCIPPLHLGHTDSISPATRQHYLILANRNSTSPMGHALSILLKVSPPVSKQCVAYPISAVYPTTVFKTEHK